jgi:hypothetical protein
MKYFVIQKRERTTINMEKRVSEMVLNQQALMISSTFSVWEEAEENKPRRRSR